MVLPKKSLDDRAWDTLEMKAPGPAVRSGRQSPRLTRNSIQIIAHIE